ncbi:DUF883 family protein [Beijerinckia indica]|uniref:DUF883 domain-containing protein n=1 Tax=Beijerinckia indica subsp. indica (strain ATCC 9039 / DSM 1715 / NCIMB 8712) TaxID=395963 RepID=B2ID32_BEII9|nr:DUF883 family protein [Beijerinckia indica]ACB96797.1 hypothetical protein Bind_3237 [Beijerinckia indica subsp. indica ATCC 9039]
MSMPKPLDEASQELSADLTALRNDIAKLSSSVAELVRSRAHVTSDTVFGVVDQARQKFTESAHDAKDRLSNSAAQAQEQVSGISADIEATIERNPIIAVLIAAFAGLLVGLISRPRA